MEGAKLLGVRAKQRVIPQVNESFGFGLLSALFGPKV
jgi:hypothetical protein